MGYIFRFIQKGPAGVVLKAIIAALIGDGLLLGFILLRRTYRKRYFARRDARAVFFQKLWGDLISGKIPYESWRGKPFDRRVVEALALDALEASPPAEAAQILKFLRASGLLQKRIYEAEKHHGWRRRRALVALGRTRAPEGIHALAEGLRDRDSETRLASLRGLGRTGLPEAAEEILRWVGEVGLVVPALPLENSLINCSRERPRVLLPYMKGGTQEVREALARVFGEVASAALETDIIEMAGDSSPELRASAARALAHAKPRIAVPVLAKMIEDSAWIVRLRAAVALGQIHSALAIPPLLVALTDSHRLVRLRAAQAIVEQDEDPVNTFERVVATGDLYAQDAYITAAENAGAYATLLEAIEQASNLEEPQRQKLLTAARFRLNAGVDRKAGAPEPDVVPS
ncbi:MAG TPA: HEAT repeat domain-containing protein [Candidatus Limnocylindrales bacterium]|nr:HEAT repeat domain-containing protein [Candidatus Limnocylindrales bacterium]